ncbi:MAG TPA: FAD-binding oxidoreductase [Rhodospirillales bacterium]|nr:FAD-binding oxidoreductase [Rhodospirillales bacterium]
MSIHHLAPATGPVDPDVLAALRAVVGDRGWVEDAADMAPYLTEERGRFNGACAAVLKPADTGEVAAIIRICSKAGLAVVPQGGNTGLVGGGVPDGGIVLSLARMNRVRAIDPLNRTITAESGVILSDLQAAARDAGALFPLSLGAEGSCRIGGNLATNAGGITVVRYGNARDMVLGLEVVLPDGRVWDGLKGLRKNNTGYDLKHLFVGSEGTLGIITAAVLKLFPKPRGEETALVALPSVEAALELFQRCNAAAGDVLTAFEFFSRRCLDFCLAHVAGVGDPFADAHPAYALIKLSSPREGEALRDALEGVLADAMEAEVVSDAVLAMSEAQADQLWRIRESIPEAQKGEGGSIKNDVSVPLSQVPAFIARAGAAVEAAMPGIRVVAFGHFGDGNIHFNLSQPVGADRSAFLAEWDRFDRIVADVAADLDGSFSAEHGVGRLKCADMLRYKSPVELDLMRKIKRALDPQNIMNPGKVVPLD